MSETTPDEVQAWCTGGCNTFTTVPADTPEDQRAWTCSRCSEPEDEDRYGFRWGPMRVTRLATFPRAKGASTYVLNVTSDTGKSLDIYVSQTGRSVRAFLDGRELT